MSPAVYHVLTEAEPFSEYHGGAISRVVANLISGDSNSRVIATAADNSWGIPPEQIRTVSAFRIYGRLIPRNRNPLPVPLKVFFLRLMLERALFDLLPHDIVWVHNRLDIAAALSPLVRKRGAKLVLHMHNSHLLMRMQVRALKGVPLNKLVFVSEFLRKQAPANITNLYSTAVLHNGADEKLFFPETRPSGEDAQPKTVLFASRLVPQKGPHVFLKAMEMIGSRGVNAAGVIVGSAAFGDAKPTSYVKRLHESAPSNVTFHEYCSGVRLAEYFRTSDLFCIPSIFDDPFPLAPLEAMASKLAVVATQSGGIPEAFSEGGALLIPKDSAARLAEALETLLLNTSLREEIADAGYASYRRQFTWSCIRLKYQEIIKAVSLGFDE